MEVANTKSQVVASIEKCFEILELLAANKQGWGIRELARTLKISKSSVGRILATLKQHHYVEEDNHANYYLGTSFYTLCAKALSHNNLRLIALEHMRKIVDQFNETVYFYIWNGTGIVFIDRIECNHTLRYVLELGRVYPIYVGAAAKTILASLPEAECERILRSIKMEAITPNTITDPEVLLKEVKAIKERGYAFSKGERIEGIIAIAAPIVLPNNKIVGGITINIPETRFNPEQEEIIGKAIASAAQAISLQAIVTGGR